MQAHNGKATKGEYRVKLPDGRVQIVSYTADNGGYRADIRYDKGETTAEKQTNNRILDDRKSTLNLVSNSPNVRKSFKQIPEKTESPLLYFNEIRTFNVPTTSRSASYETVENVDEEQFPYSKKLLADVNYLLKYVTPTLETQTENVFDITPDSKVFENRYFNAQAGSSSHEVIKEPESPQNTSPFSDLKLQEVKFTHPPLDSSNYEKQNTESSHFSPSHISQFNISSKTDSSEFNEPQYETRQLVQLNTQKYNQKEHSQFVPKFQTSEPSFSAPEYDFDEQQQFNTPKYDSRDQSIYSYKHNNRGPAQFDQSKYNTRPIHSNTLNYKSRDQPHSIPKYEIKNTQSYSTPKYGTQQSQSYSTPKYGIQQNFESSSQLGSSRYQLSEQPYLLPQKYESREQHDLPRYEKPKYESSEFLSSSYDDKQFKYRPINSQDYNQIGVSLYNTAKLENHDFDSLPFRPSRYETSKFNSPSSPPKLVKYSQPDFNPISQGPLKFTSQEYSTVSPDSSNYVTPELQSDRPSTVRYNSEEFVPFSPNSKYNSQENTPVSPTPNYNSQEYPPVSSAPRFNPRDFPPVSAVTSTFNSQELTLVTPTVPLFKPTPSTDEMRKTVNEHQFGKIEIPQYLHIHKYETSGEDSKPKELIYYTPLQIPVPNSITYMQQGHHNVTDLHHSQLLPSYVTMTEHPRIETNNLPSRFKENLFIPEYQSHYDSNLTSNFVKSDSLSPSVPTENSNFENPDYHTRFSQPLKLDYKKEDYDTDPLKNNDENISSPPSVDEEQSNEEQDNYENYNNGLSDFDARIYSGYFDFVPTSEAQLEKQTPDDYPEPSVNDKQNTETPIDQNTPLPQYYYDFSTASPTHRYISSEIGSQELNAISDDDQLRNSSFLASAYLRPLRKERVYIHHNSLPTLPSDERFSSVSTTSRPQHKQSDVTIVKSISSTIPPELLKDFDSQLRSSVFRDDNYNVGNELKETKISLPTTQSPKLNKILLKKLQSTLPSMGEMYLKTQSKQKRIVR